MLSPVIFHNANCVDFDKRSVKHRSLYLKNCIIERIIADKKSLPRGVQKIDLKGKYIIPGFIDSHTHLISRGIELQRTDLEKCNSLNDCLEKLQSVLHKDEIVFGSNWDESNWNSFSINKLNRQTLDRLSKKKPIVMRRICGHFAVANTKALQLIQKKWKIVDRKKGHLYEDAALNLNDIFKPTRIMLQKAVALGTKEAIAKGITSVHEIANLDRFKFLQQIEEKDGLKLRFSIYILLKYFKGVLAAGMRRGSGDDYLRFCGIKVFLDGSIGARTAGLKKPYRNARTKGKILIPMQRVERIIKVSEENSIQLMVHSIGDRTTAEVVKVFEKNINKRNPLRHRLEHIEIVDSSAIRTMAKMNLIASMQPNFAKKWQQPNGMYEHYLGERYKRMNCFKTMKDYGVRIAFGSDCMPLGPLYGIEGALKHPFVCGRLHTHEAFNMYTKEGAYATFDETRKGVIERGKLADLVVLDKNPLRAKDLDKVKIMMVIIGGKIVYKNRISPIDMNKSNRNN